MRARIKVDDRAVLRGLRGIRRDIDRAMRDGLKQAVERWALPMARTLSPSRRVDAALRAGATSRTAYIEVRRRDVEFFGIDEFGGTRGDTILPRNAKALGLPGGPRAAVHGLRTYKAWRILARTIRGSRELVLREAERVMVQSIETHLDVS